MSGVEIDVEMVRRLVGAFSDEGAGRVSSQAVGQADAWASASGAPDWGAEPGSRAFRASYDSGIQWIRDDLARIGAQLNVFAENMGLAVDRYVAADEDIAQVMDTLQTGYEQSWGEQSPDGADAGEVPGWDDGSAPSIPELPDDSQG